jgi:endonuclease/exonuclease/phosphatase family metal-dependent hydrolase
VAAVIRRFEPDLALLNETGPRWRLARLGRALGMQVAHDPRSPLRRRVPNAVLARPPWRVVRHHLHRFADVRRRLNPRGAIIARVHGPDGVELSACCIHLGLHPLERLHAVRELPGLRLGDPALIGGDLNEPPDGRTVRELRARFADAWELAGGEGGETFPAARPVARIDYLFVSPGIRVERALVPAALPEARRASDHLPLVVDLALGAGG